MEGTSRSRALRALLAGSELAVIAEAHDALSARIVEEAGLPCIWASGLAMSAALGMRDASEASMTQVLDVLERMADASELPILVDGDTGFGNFNNARMLVRKLCQRGLAGVVVEDKLFPKANSFVGPDRQLAEIDEVCGKLRAMCDARSDPAFCVIARVEALIAGRGLAEALRRAEAYRAAGADAIVIHSRRATADEVLGFAARWERRAPLIAIPTTYPAIDREAFRRAGFAAIICANHNLRAAITAMRAACAQLVRDGHAAALEPTIAPLRDVFTLTRVPELLAAEARYLPPDRMPRAIVLAARKPPARMVDALTAARVQPITVLRGPGAPAIDAAEIAVIEHAAVSEAHALRLAAPDGFDGPLVIARAELALAPHVLPALAATPGELVALIDGADLATGRFAGLLRASATGASWLAAALAAGADGSLRELVHRVEAAGHPVRVLHLGGGWTEA